MTALRSTEVAYCRAKSLSCGVPLFYSQVLSNREREGYAYSARLLLQAHVGGLMQVRTKVEFYFNINGLPSQLEC